MPGGGGPAGGACGDARAGPWLGVVVGGLAALAAGGTGVFALDRDLLVYEPSLFNDVAWTGQRVLGGTLSTSGTGATIVSSEPSLAASGVGVGHVVLIARTPYEVVGLGAGGGGGLELSRVRARVEDAALPPPAVSGAAFEVMSFGPQLAETHRRVLRMLGFNEGDDESVVVNPRDLVMLECFGALHLIYAAASVLGGPMSAEGQRAEMYRQRFAAERHRAVARLDLDGDGKAEVTRRPNALRLVRV